ncbi:hypothetical protein H6G58_23115 [Arthrospira platensis FACHB-971]|uniref:Transposase n=7 Tax=Limnospira platensis TaxID=118562 RepID=A0A5M3T515_LIMPL|nr:hypothetical protein [Arthrospira platensis FACHB-971]BDT14112.1 hypothetical protein N39L_38350 [Arthrospira platensis NIES-39]GCE92896.1 hypothetical protein NIES46_09400 [Arthrospira platensis NIES-46]
MTSTGGKNRLESQSHLAFSTALALLGFLDVITIQGCWGLEQVFAKMRIAVPQGDGLTIILLGDILGLLVRNLEPLGNLNQTTNHPCSG